MRLGVLILVCVFASAGVARASDEFGARFGNTAPSALEEPLPPSALEDIAPAAGDEASGPSAGQASFSATTGSAVYGPPEYLEYDPAQEAPASAPLPQAPVAP